MGLNAAFTALPPDKQKNLIRAGFKTFARCPYDKASMAAIAAEAGVSKSLLFYYFKDKRELYLFLFAQALRQVGRVSEAGVATDGVELFCWVEHAVAGRLALLREQPDLLRFATRAYYETDARVQPDLNRRKQELNRLGFSEVLKRLDRSRMKNPDEAETLLSMILCLAEGCMQGQEALDGKALAERVALFQRMMQSLKTHYLIPETMEGDSK